MDELLHYCLRELAFDGDLGCKVSRLRDFVDDFYTRSPTSGVQNTDDAFHAFVWSLVAQQPTVIIGTVPPGITSEVWIAPQTSAQRKAKEKGQVAKVNERVTLDLVDDAKNRTLQDLEAEYGDKLRIATDPQTTYVAITGTHIHFPKMSPMVYSALQLVTRGRDNGISVIQLGQQSKYDQKTCFYLIKQLTELDLVVKVRRGGINSNFCIHKYFYERNEAWKSIREEELRAKAEDDVPPPADNDVDLEEDEADPERLKALDFTPIDARHLSSLPLIKARVLKLLKSSKNQMHASQNMLIAIGFNHPTKTHRRFFTSLTREMIQQGVMESVFVPNKKTGLNKPGTKCFRLVAADREQVGEQEESDVIVQRLDEDDSNNPEVESGSDRGGVKMNWTIHKQMFSLVEESGTTGMTHYQLSDALGQFDKRTLELLLQRAGNFPPPAHLVDLQIIGRMENFGRERRQRYFTAANYEALVEQEKLDKEAAKCLEINQELAGGFYPFSAEVFHEDEAALVEYQDRDSRSVTGAGRGHKKRINPLLPDGTVKKGRPRKVLAEGETPKSRKRKRAGEDVDGEPQQPAAKRKKKGAGTRFLYCHNDVDGGVLAEADDAVLVEDVIPSTEPPAPKKRGRPPKNQEPSADGAPAVPKKRGRPSKQKPSDDAIDAIEKKATPRKKRGRQDAEAEAPPIAVLDSTDVTPAPHAKRARVDPVPDNTATVVEALDELADDDLDGIGEMEVDMESGPVQPKVEAVTQPVQSEGRPVDAAPEALPAEPQVEPQVELRVEPQVEVEVDVPPVEIAPVEQTATRVSNFNQSHRTDHDMSQTRRVNVSSLRRQNELFRVLQECGGILNLYTKEVYDDHQALLTTLSRNGEPTSAPPGTRLDRRTAVTAFNDLESRGKVKQLKATAISSSGTQRLTSLVYLPEMVDQTKITAFVAEVGRNMLTLPVIPSKSVLVGESAQMEYGSKSRAKLAPSSKAVALIPRKPRGSTRDLPTHAEELFAHDDETVRDVLLTERVTVGQLYGFLPGKLIRARELHVYLVNMFESSSVQSSMIVSHQERILSFSWFFTDMGIGMYCALVATTAVCDELTDRLETRQGQAMSIKEAGPGIHAALSIGRSRSRARIIDILDTLRCLGLITPLEEVSPAGHATVTCAPSDKYPSAFEEVTDDAWSADSLASAPRFWRLNSSAPLHHWAASDKAPPFLQNLAVQRYPEAVAYWKLLQQACEDEVFPPNVNGEAPPAGFVVKKIRSITRKSSWTEEYAFSWHQTTWISKQLDRIGHPGGVADPNVPADGQIERLAWVVSAPVAEVREHVRTVQANKAREAAKIADRKRREAEKCMQNEEVKASLAKKAADARAEREIRWDALLNKVHPGPIGASAGARLNRVRTLYMQAVVGANTSKWEHDILQAIQDAGFASSAASVAGLGKRAKRASTSKSSSAHSMPSVPVAATLLMPVGAPPVVSKAAPAKSVASLVAMQGPAIVEKSRKKQKIKKGAVALVEEEKTPSPSPGPRTRFQWNKDYEELAKDAYVILQSRCRSRGKLDYSQFKQVFPAVPRNSIRNHVKSMRDASSTAAYLTRLEDQWHRLWIQYRGTLYLRDDDYLSLEPDKFSLVEHVEFLRKSIDKNALRVGFAEEAAQEQNTIPASLEELLDTFDVVEAPATVPAWDFMWSGSIEDGREKRALRQAMTMRPDDIFASTILENERIPLAETALKMVMSVAAERYDPAEASKLLHGIGQDAVVVAQKNLLGRGVLSKRFKNPGRKPGRMLRISDMNSNAIGGSIPKETFQDAIGLEEISSQDETWREWPLLSTDGDTAALLQAVSDGKVDFRIDTSQVQAARAAIDWNSKKADDDDIETAIFVKFHDMDMEVEPERQQSDESASRVMPVDLEHEVNCRKVNEDTLVSCSACLAEDWNAVLSSADDRAVLQLVLDTVEAACSGGMSKRALLAQTNLSPVSLQSVVKAITEAAVPRLFWLGYSGMVLVSAAFLESWTVQLSGTTRAFPRRWLDFTGSKVTDLWEAALHAVMGVLVFHPGITQALLRWRLRSVYDRQEVNELLKYLCDEGFIAVRGSGSGLEADDEEEHRNYLFVGTKSWYSV
ncbi:unnamed protein product [Mycena citricolor]|uniref:B-block binding subunit of TFIIIC domain-containing protein n=1 Tax=Mycena citricolor TaxID=2018698 RepID=A0AAD2Q1D2_9AGAR|nr:unnamed protein product [Mycena citricolor]